MRETRSPPLAPYFHWAETTLVIILLLHEVSSENPEDDMHLTALSTWLLILERRSQQLVTLL